MSTLRVVNGQVDAQMIRELLRPVPRSTVEEIENQLDTALRVRHDIWAMYIESRIAESEDYEIFTFEDTKNLSPDIVYKDCRTNEIWICEVTFTLNQDILEEKERKYRVLTPNVLLCSPIKNTFLPAVFPDALPVFRRYTEETNSLFRRFDEHVASEGFDPTELHEYQVLRQNPHAGESIRWPKLPNKKNPPEPLSSKLKKNIPEGKSTEDLLDLLTDRVTEMMDDPQVNAHYSLSPLHTGIFETAMESVERKIAAEFQKSDEYKPSIMFYAPMDLRKLPFKFKTEQELILEQVKCLAGTKSWVGDLVSPLVEILANKEEMNIFTKGVPTDDWEESDLRKMYKASTDLERLKSKRQPERRGRAKIVPKDENPERSFLQYCQQEHMGREDPVEYQVKRRKCVDLFPPGRTVLPSTSGMIDKAKTGMSSTEYVQSKMEKAAKVRAGELIRESVHPSSYKGELQDYVLESSVERRKTDLPQAFERMHYPMGVDNQIFTRLKEDAMLDFETFTGMLAYTPVLRYAATQKANIEQLLHIQNLSLKKGYFSFFNSGTPEVLYIVQHGFQNRGRDVGRAFIVVAFGEITDTEKSLYGFVDSDVSRTKGKEVRVSWTNWRRLPSQRLTFHADQVYSAFMTTFASFSRRLDMYRLGSIQWKTLCSEVRRTYCMRTLISLSHSQSTAEILSDMRYLYMDAFSTHASVSEFCADKFARQIRTMMDAHLVSSIPLFDKVKKEFETGGVQVSILEFTSGQRDDKTTGGKIMLTSVLHVGTKIRDVQDLLDDMFLYVHTNKEPSSAYHEFVKAFNTIIKFQKIHDSHDYRERMGIYDTSEELRAYLLRDDKVGFWDVATHLAGMMIADKIERSSVASKIDRVIRSDTILDMSSTKSIIPERERVRLKIEDEDDDRITRKQKALWNEVGSESAPFQNVTYTERLGKSDKLVVLGGTNRAKVHDSTIDIVSRLRLNRSIDLARWNIEKNQSRVITDICIKAQYGAKREFYVVNHGAKAMARVLEKGYRVVCETLEEEMISVSGDRKMFNIQSLLDRAMLTSAKSKKQVFFCNGDCTKWSAAETMECLSVFNNSMASTVGSEFSEYAGHVLEAWSKKTIEIPKDLRKNIYFSKPEVAEVLEKETFHSTQNFLQGMFNYLSSAKAVGCSELLRRVWFRQNPDSNLNFYHMEHSDDYAFIVLTDTVEEFEKFKLMHRILMRFCGINDSTKKTNCQKFLLEFISLLSFNGMMTYPHIKKIKETGLNIGCLGYSSDIQTTCSRVGEAVRVGMPMKVAYVMQRVQNVRIAEAYGLFSSNSTVVPFTKLTNTPTELWGLPDCWPLCYTLTKGDPNSYRLNKFGGEETKELINKLFWLKQAESLADHEEVDDVTYTNVSGLFHPGYNYLSRSKLLNRIREICGYTIERARKYWEDHFFDLYLKPKDPSRYMDWLYSKYFQRSFGEAYMRQSRFMLQLRLSTFVNTRCLTTSFNPEIFGKIFKGQHTEESLRKKMTVKEYSSWFDQLEIDEDSVNAVRDTFAASKEVSVYSFDPTVVLIYDFLQTASYDPAGLVQTTTKAYSEPSKKFEYTTHSDPIRILQYIFAPKDFFVDGYRTSDVTVFMADVKRVKALCERYGVRDSDTFNKSPYKRIIMDHLTAAKGSAKPLLLKFNPQNDVTNTITKMIESHTSYTQFFKVNIGLADELVSRTYAVDEETGLYLPSSTLSKDWYMKMPQVLEDIGLLLFLVKDLPEHQIRSILSRLRTKEGGKTVYEVIEAHVDSYLDRSAVLNSRQEQLICALHDYVNNSATGLDVYVTQKMAYSYRYHKNTPETGFTTVDLKLLGEDFKVVFRETETRGGHDLTLVTTSQRLNTFGWAYLAGLRLCGAISVNEYVKRLAWHPTDSIPYGEPLPLDDTASHVYKSKVTGKLTIKSDPGMEMMVPILRVDTLTMSEGLTKEDEHSLPRFNLKHFSVYTGRSKVYTINPYTLRQVNAWESPDSVFNIPLNVLMSQRNLQRMLQSQELRIPGLEDFPVCMKERIDELVILTSYSTKVPDVISRNREVLVNVLSRGSKNYSYLKKKTADQNVPIKERILDAFGSQEAHNLIGFREPPKIPLKKYWDFSDTEHLVHMGTPASMLEGMEYKTLLMKIELPEDLRKSMLTLVDIVMVSYYDNTTNEEMYEQLLDLDKAVDEFLQIRFSEQDEQDRQLLEAKSNAEDKKTTGNGTAETETAAFPIYRLESDTDDYFNFLEKLGPGCDNCSRYRILPNIRELNMDLPADVILEPIEEYGCPDCPLTEPETEIQLSGSADPEDPEGDCTVYCLDDEGFESFGCLKQVGKGCEMCNFCIVRRDCFEFTSLGLSEEEIVTPFEDYPCPNNCSPPQNLRSYLTSKSQDVPEDHNSETAEAETFDDELVPIVRTKLGYITTRFDLYKVLCIILANKDVPRKLFYFTTELVGFFEVCADKLPGWVNLRVMLPPDTAFLSMDSDQYILESKVIASDYPPLMSKQALRDKGKTTAGQEFDIDEFLETASQAAKSNLFKMTYPNWTEEYKEYPVCRIQILDDLVLAENVLVESTMYEKAPGESDELAEDGLDPKNYVDVADTGAGNVKIHPTEMHLHRALPYTVQTATTKMSKIEQLVAASLILGKCEFRKMERSLRIHALHRITELAQQEDVFARVGNGLKEFIKSELSFMSLGNTTTSTSGYSVDITNKKEVVYRKLKSVTDHSLYRTLDQLSTIENIYICPEKPNTFEVHLPVKQSLIATVQTELDRRLVDFLDPGCVLSKHIAGMLSSKEYEDDLMDIL